MLSHMQSLCQITISGTITDVATGLPVSYANIGIFEKEIGTVCNLYGKYELVVPSEWEQQAISVTHVGYENAAIYLALSDSSSTTLNISLIPAINNLQEVVINSADEIEIGYHPNGNSVNGFFKATGLGLEGGTLIKNNDSMEITQFNFNVLKIPFDSVRFRLNFYEVKNNKPGGKVNSKDIVFTVLPSDTGFFSVPLEEANIIMSDDFICSIEWIESFGKPTQDAEFLFSAIENKHGSIFKKTISMGKWERINNYSLCFWFDGKK